MSPSSSLQTFLPPEAPSSTTFNTISRALSRIVITWISSSRTRKSTIRMWASHTMVWHWICHLINNRGKACIWRLTTTSMASCHRLLGKDKKRGLTVHFDRETRHKRSLPWPFLLSPTTSAKYPSRSWWVMGLPRGCPPRNRKKTYWPLARSQMK